MWEVVGLETTLNRFTDTLWKWNDGASARWSKSQPKRDEVEIETIREKIEAYRVKTDEEQADMKA
jgi:hypothetical protein